MKTNRTQTTSYESPIMETVELVLEGAVLDASNVVDGGGISSGTDTPSDEF